MKVKVRDKYKNLTPEELIDKAYDMGASFEKYSYGCSQATVSAIHELLGIDDMLVKVSSTLGAGTARQCLGTCGAVAGGLMVLAYFFGRTADEVSAEERVQSNLDALYSAYPTALEFIEKFSQDYKTILCPQIHRQLFGRTWWLSDPEEYAKFELAGGHSDSDKCCDVVGKAAKLVMSILVDNDAIDFGS